MGERGLRASHDRQGSNDDNKEKGLRIELARTFELPTRLPGQLYIQLAKSVTPQATFKRAVCGNARIRRAVPNQKMIQSFWVPNGLVALGLCKAILPWPRSFFFKINKTSTPKDYLNLRTPCQTVWHLCELSSLVRSVPGCFYQLDLFPSIEFTEIRFSATWHTANSGFGFAVA